MNVCFEHIKFRHSERAIKRTKIHWRNQEWAASSECKQNLKGVHICAYKNVDDMLAHVLDDWLHTQCECGYDCYVCIAAERLNNVELFTCCQSTIWSMQLYAMLHFILLYIKHIPAAYNHRIKSKLLFSLLSLSILQWRKKKWMNK